MRTSTHNETICLHRIRQILERPHQIKVQVDQCHLLKILVIKALLHVLIFDCSSYDETSVGPNAKSTVHVPNFGGLSGSEDRGGGDNSIQFINFGRMGDKSFKEWRQKFGGGGWKGG